MNAKRSLTAGEAKGADDTDLRGLMLNWVLWKLGGGGPDVGPRGSGFISSAYSLEARGRRSSVANPLINDDAVVVDQAVRALPAELRQVITTHWLSIIDDKQGRPRPWPHANEEQRAQGCRCSVRTYYRRLENAHQRILALIRARKNDAKSARAALTAFG